MSQIQNRAIRDRPLLSGPGTVSLSALTDAQRIRVFLAEANHPTRALAYGDIDRHAILNVSASEMSECYVTVGEEEGMVRLGIEDLTQKNGTVKREVERVPVSTANERVLWRFKTSSFNKSVVLVEEGVVPAIVGIEAGLKEKIKERRKKNKGTGPGTVGGARKQAGLKVYGVVYDGVEHDKRAVDRKGSITLPKKFINAAAKFMTKTDYKNLKGAQVANGTVKRRVAQHPTEPNAVYMPDIPLLFKFKYVAPDNEEIDSDIDEYNKMVAEKNAPKRKAKVSGKMGKN